MIINKGEPPGFEEELAQDVIEIVRLFSARLYGSRSPKTKRLIEEREDDGSPKVTTAFKDSAPDPVVRLLDACTRRRPTRCCCWRSAVLLAHNISLDPKGAPRAVFCPRRRRDGPVCLELGARRVAAAS